MTCDKIEDDGLQGFVVNGVTWVALLAGLP
jgi:hypothetical protein